MFLVLGNSWTQKKFLLSVLIKPCKYRPIHRSTPGLTGSKVSKSLAVRKVTPRCYGNSRVIATRQTWHSHLYPQPIKAGTRFIDAERMRGWVGLVGWSVADGLPVVVSGQPSSAGRTQNTGRSPTFYPCDTTLVLIAQAVFILEHGQNWTL